MQTLNKSKNWVMNWYVCDETGDFSRRKGSDRSSKLSSNTLNEMQMLKYKRGLSVRKISSNYRGKERTLE